MYLRDLSSQAENRNHRQKDQPDDYVAGMQSDKRIKGCSKEIGAYGQSLPKNEIAPLYCGRSKENGRQRDSRQPPKVETIMVVVAKGTFREQDRNAAGKQTDCRKNRQ